MKIKALAFAVGLFLVCVDFAFGVDYPRWIGHVNDFANILPTHTAQKLEEELRTYKRQTSIEIAVVTTPSLEGLSVEEYTLGLATAWGVGNKEKDNGLILLVAPKERKMRIEVGYGLEPDVTDTQAGRIIRDTIIPFFKNGKMADGIEQGVSEILAQLGQKPFQDRLEGRRVEAEKRRLAAAEAKETFLYVLAVLSVTILPVLLFFLLIVFFMRRVKKRHDLWLVHKANERNLALCKEKLSEAENELPPAKEALAELKGVAVEELWKPFEKAITEMPKALMPIKQELLSCENLFLTGWKNAYQTASAIETLSEKINTRSSLLEEIKEKTLEIKNAESDADRLLKTLPDSIEHVREILRHPDVKPGAQHRLQEAAEHVSEANRLIHNKGVNWLLVFGALLAAEKLISHAEASAQNDKTEAEKARKEGPQLLESLPDAIEEAKERVSRAEVTSETKQMVGEAEEKFQRARSLASESFVDWLAIFALLAVADSLIKGALHAAETDEYDAVKRRRKRQRSRDDAYSSTAWSSGGSSDDSSSGGFGGGGFGGFGGGGFGGGGASGSW